MSWGRFSPQPPAQLSVLAVSRGAMFGFIKTCECKKKREGKWEKVGHARHRKRQKVFPYLCTWGCRTAPFRCVWIRTVKECVPLQNSPSDKLLWRTPCQSNWLLCTPEQIKRTWLWNLKIKTKAPSSAVCKSTDSVAADCVSNNCNYIPELSGGAKQAQERWLTIQFLFRHSLGTDRHSLASYLIRWSQNVATKHKKTKLSAVVKYKHADVPAIFLQPPHLMRV